MGGAVAITGLGGVATGLSSTIYNYIKEHAMQYNVFTMITITKTESLLTCNSYAHMNYFQFNYILPDEPANQVNQHYNYYYPSHVGYRTA